MPQLVLPNSISQESTKRVQFNTLVSTLGNSFKRYHSNGSNNSIVFWNVVRTHLTKTEMILVTEQYDAAGRGIQLLQWTPPNETVQKNWVLPNGYDIKPIAANVYTVTALFEEDK